MQLRTLELLLNGLQNASSNWVSESKNSIVSRGVTTCAGMTAHTVVLAQTRVGFLTGGRKKSFLDLLQDEQTVIRD